MMALLLLSLAAAEPVEICFEDQFEAKQELKAQRGKVVVLVYGDRAASDACRTLGEELHVHFHPTAKGLTGGKARQQPAAEVPGMTAPGVLIQAVACCGKMPRVLRPVLQTQIAKASPDVPVWLDFDQTMTSHFGLTTGQTNVALFDAAGRYRHKINGTLTPRQVEDLIRQIHNLRVEAAK